ncbi:eukaryotic and archaeal DNA primase small subunit [Schizothecium vesticola]|uniref:DNA primase n=1 Tax=Schizothecium vesticola TaxID=314040 RepID=A0AA40F2C7_9PEZI|nr:eukaryotic and archaeal DNA primase small subunit [Schizothecium vesticola]
MAEEPVAAVVERGQSPKEDDVDMADAAAPPAQEKPDVNLDDLFADMDSDDEEFPSSKPPPQIATQDSNSSSPSDEVVLTPTSDQNIAHMNASDPELLRSFYQRLFPWRYLFQWLNHSPTPTPDFENREFAFTLPNDAMLRYMSYRTSDLLRKDVLRLMPTRIEIGPSYTTNPRERKMLQNTAGFRPLSKELCFDIDLTDYDDIRTCCDKANICNKCWRFMVMAVKVVEAVLRDDFGFKHIMWVYSGRRGIHAWVSDKSARTMDDSKRKVIAGYLEVIIGGAQSGKRVNLRRPLHPHLSRSLDLLKSHFQDDVLEAQDPWQTPARAEKLLQLLPDKDLRDALRKKWDASPGRSSLSKWADIDAVAKTTTSKSFDPRALLDAKQDIVLEYTYPRLDINVSKKLNHLLKSPFVIHPGTGRVCVPIDTRRLDDFSPLEVPTIQGLIREIDEWKEPEVKPEKPVHDWEKTSLKPYIEYFRGFVNAMMKGERGDGKVKRERGEEEGDGELW